MNKGYKKISLKEEKGFTLIEILVSISIFAVIMTVSMGAILGVFDANRKSQSLRSVMDNMNFSVEAMSREMRFGSNYHCGSDSLIKLKEPQSCPTVPKSQVSFLSSDATPTQITYKLNGTQIEKAIGRPGGATTFIPVTSPEIKITSLVFYVVGAKPSPTDKLQPKILMKITGSAGSKAGTESEFTLQTLVTQRLQDS